MENAILIYVILAILFFGMFFGMFFLVLKSQKQESKPVDSSRPSDGAFCPKKHLEFMKALMVLMLIMWVMGGLVGLWIAITDTSFLASVQDYIVAPVQSGIAVYGVKSGAENWQKIATSKTETAQTPNDISSTG